MIKKIIKNGLMNSKPTDSIASAALLITVAGLISRILGLFRDRLLASTFGAGDTLDVYYAAFRIPDLIYNLLILGALSAAFIPVFTSLLANEKDEEAWDMANGILNIAVLFMVVISLFFFLFTPFFMKIMTPGFSPEKMEKVILFSRIMFLSPLFLGISGVFGGILTSLKRFLIYSLAPIFYNVGIIIGISFFNNFWGPVGLAWGVVLGAFLHMLIQYPAAKQLGFKHALLLKKYFKDANIKKIFKLMIPRTLGIAVSQVNLLVITFFASLLASGSLAVFNFAQNMESVPLGIFGISFSIAVFPTLSHMAAKKDEHGFIKNFSRTFRQILFFVIPASVFIILLRAQLVRVILGAGQFDWNDTKMTYGCLGILSASLFAQSLIPLLARSFYALHDTKTPFFIAITAEAVNIGTVLLLIGKFQVIALAIAFSLAAVSQMLLLLFFLRIRYSHLDDNKIIRSIFKISLATIVSGLIIQKSKDIIGSNVNMDTFLGVFIQLGASSVIGLAIFLIVCQLIKIEEFIDFKKSLSKRIFRTKQIIVEDTGEVSGI
jgi:putative peptidoglycan lipid II flippase